MTDSGDGQVKTCCRVLIITVNYKGARTTEEFLRSAGCLKDFASAHLIVVENGSGDDSADTLRSIVAQFYNVELLESRENRGYFGAAKWALEHFRKSASCDPDWIIVCNNDITFKDDSFLTALLRRDSKTEHVIAPAIVTPDEIDCNPFLRERPSAFQLARFGFWQSNYYLMWFKQWLSPHVRGVRHRLHRRHLKASRTAIYAPHGAFLIFSHAYFERGGYIDDGFFLYAEEFSVAEICRRLGLSVTHDPELRVWHEAHQVTGRMCNRKTFEWGREGFKYAVMTYFSPSATVPSGTDSVSGPDFASGEAIRCEDLK